MVERMLVGLLARGHLLLEGVPGVAKTLAVRTLADVVGGIVRSPAVHPRPDAERHHRHPRVAHQQRDVRRRAAARSSPTWCSPTRSTARPPRCSRRCSRRWPRSRCRSPAPATALPDPFLVLATQNPVESEGVYRLPEAQRDRFLLKIDVPYPTGQEEFTILHRMSVDPPRAEQVLTPARRDAAAAGGRRDLRAPLGRRPTW